MKKIIFFLFILCVILNETSAQELSFGVVGKAGISQVIYSVDTQSTGFDISNKYRFSYAGGAYGSIKISEKSSIGAELLFRRQNGSYEITFDIIDTTSQTHYVGTEKDFTYVSYLALPVYYSYSINAISLHLGVHGNWALSQKGKTIIDATLNSDTIHTETERDTLNFKKFDFGINAGIRYDIRQKFFLGIDYYLGFLNLLKTNAANAGAQNQNIAASIGFRIFPASKKEETIYVK